MFSLDPYTTTVVNSVADPASTAQTGDISSIIPADRVRLKRLRPGDNVVLEDMGDAIRIATNTVSNPAVLMDPSDLDLLADDGHTIKRLRAGDHIVMTSEPDHIRIGSVGPVSAAATGGVSLVQPDFVIKDLKAGTNIALDNNNDCVTIHSTASGGGSLPSLTTVGSGLSWVDDGALHHIRGIQNLGTHLQMTLSEDGKDIQLQDTFVPYTPTVLTGTGGSYTLAHTATPLGIKGLSAGTNISIVPSDTDVTINNTYSYTETPLTTSGTGTSLKKSDHVLKDLKAGSLITLTATEDDVTIQGVAPAAISSAGTGSTSLVGSATQSLKSLQAGTHINLATDGDTVTIHNTYSYTPPAPTVLSNAGTNGVSLVGSAAQSIKSLVPGSNVTLTTNGDEVTVAAATQTFTETPITTSGTGTSILQSGHILKDLKAGSNITITNTTNDVTIAADTQTFTETPITTTGTGTSLLKSGHTLKDLKAGANVTLTNNTDDVTIATTYSETATTSAGATGGVSLINANHVIKDLKAGTNITLDTTDPKCIVLNSVDPEVPITTTGTGTSILKSGSTFKDLKAGTNIAIASGTDDLTISATSGTIWPSPLFSFDFLYYACCTSWGTVTTEPNGTSIKYMICPETKTQYPCITFSNTIPYVVAATSTTLPLKPNVQCTDATTRTVQISNTSGGNGLEPWTAGTWMIMVLSIQGRDPTHIFHKTDGTGPRISLSIPSKTNNNVWRVTISNSGFTTATSAYWDVAVNSTVVVPNANNAYSWVVAFQYNATNCKIRIQNSPLIQSPEYSTWTLESGNSTPITSLTLTSKYTLSYDVTTQPYLKRTQNLGISGSNWYIFNHPSDPNAFNQSFNLYALRFYPSMTDTVLNSLFDNTKLEFWTNLP